MIRAGRGGIRFAWIAAATAVSPLLTCARTEPPPGGPPDNVPPVVASTEPGSFSVVPDFRGPVILRFSERISEQPEEGTVDDAILVSPATSPVEVEFQRSAIQIDLEDGFEPGRVYRIRVTPVVNDMFDNPMLDPFELVFSTGPEIGGAVVGGIVQDRISGEPVSGARVHASPAGDSVRDSTVTDSPASSSTSSPLISRTDAEGIFTLRYVPVGRYELRAFDDVNRNGEPDGPEPFDLQVVSPTGEGDTLLVSMAILEPDTTPPIVAQVEAPDSLSLRIVTDDYLDPSEPPETVRSSIVSDSAGAPPQVFQFIHWPEWEERQAEADSSAAGGSDADDLGDAQDAGPPLPRRELYGLLDQPLEAGVEYEITITGLVNIAGAGGGEGEATFVWEPPPPDTLDAAADSLDVPPDSVDTVPDSLDALPDSVPTAPAPGAGNPP